jgi:hypothetical protein
MCSNDVYDEREDTLLILVRFGSRMTLRHQRSLSRLPRTPVAGRCAPLQRFWGQAEDSVSMQSSSEALYPDPTSTREAERFQSRAQNALGPA